MRRAQRCGMLVDALLAFRVCGEGSRWAGRVLVAVGGWCRRVPFVVLAPRRLQIIPIRLSRKDIDEKRTKHSMKRTLKMCKGKS